MACAEVLWELFSQVPISYCISQPCFTLLCMLAACCQVWDCGSPPAQSEAVGGRARAQCGGGFVVLSSRALQFPVKITFQHKSVLLLELFAHSSAINKTPDTNTLVIQSIPFPASLQ